MPACDGQTDRQFAIAQSALCGKNEGTGVGISLPATESLTTLLSDLEPSKMTLTLIYDVDNCSPIYVITKQKAYICNSLHVIVVRTDTDVYR